MDRTPLLTYLREVLDEHTLPLENSEAGLVEALWLLHMVGVVEEEYKKNGLLR